MVELIDDCSTTEEGGMDDALEELYRPLPDTGAYLKRIGIDEAKSPDAAFLDELVLAHQTHVPFENLDIFAKALVPSLGIPDLFAKIVTRNRGGYCFELNALFAALLKALGYDVQPCMARVLLHPDPHPIIRHRANIITIGRTRHLVDVGFGGPMAPFALLVEDGAVRMDGSHAFAVRKRDDYWWDIGYTDSEGKERIVLSVCDMPVAEEDFVPLSYYQAQPADSVFRLNRMANIRTADGAFNLRNSTYTEFRGGEKAVKEITDEAEIARLLHDKFGIEL